MEKTEEGIEEVVDRQPTMAEILRPKVKRDKPEIDHLEDVVRVDEESGMIQVDVRVGDRIVIERYSGILKERPWLDTKPYYVNGIDTATGKLTLYFEELQQHATDNFIIGLKLGNKYKKIPPHGRWDIPPKVIRKPAPEPQKAAAGPFVASEEPIKKGRGRPKGSKNRPREEIEEERRLVAAARLAKRAARLAKRS